MVVGECDNIAGELAEAQAMVSELSKEHDELSASLSSLEAEHANLTDNHESLRYHGLQTRMTCPARHACMRILLNKSQPGICSMLQLCSARESVFSALPDHGDIPLAGLIWSPRWQSMRPCSWPRQR